MKAAIYKQYGGPEVIQVTNNWPKPKPKANEILIKVHTSTVSTADWRLRSLTVPNGFGFMVRLFFGFTKPRKAILGTECAGEVVEIGSDVKRFAVGDRVVAYTGGNLGCHAEFIALSDRAPVVPIPRGLDLSQAASLCFGGITALDFLTNKTQIKVGDKILVIGAAGTVGSAAVQLASYFGAEVTAVTSSHNLALAKANGAHRCIDYTQQNPFDTKEYFDIIFDAVGSSSTKVLKESLVPKGKLLLITADLNTQLVGLIGNLFGSKKCVVGVSREHLDDLVTLKNIVEAGGFIPNIDSVFEINQISAAYSRVDSGRKRGSVVVKMADDLDY